MSNENKAMSEEKQFRSMTHALGLIYTQKQIGDYLSWIITSDEVKEYWQVTSLTSQITHLEGMVRQANEQNETLIKQVDGLKEELQNSEFDCDFQENMRNQAEHALKESGDKNISLLKQVGELKEDLARDNKEWLDLGQEYVAKLAAEKQNSERLLEALKKICECDEMGIRKILKIESVNEMANIASSALTAYEGKNTEG